MRNVGLLACLSMAIGMAGITACSSSDTGTGGAGTTNTAGSGGTGGATSTSESGGSAPAGTFAAAVKRYDYVFDTEALTADTKLTLEVAAPGGDCTELESVNAPSGEVTWAGEPAVSASVDSGVLHACGAAVGPGELTLQAPTMYPKKKYYGLDVGYSVKTNMDGGKFSYLLSWVGGCDFFGPCDDDPGTLAEFHYEIHHPAGATVICPGALTASETSTTCEIAGTLAPTYSATGWASDPMWQRTPFLTANGVDWVFYEVPSGNLRASLDVATMTDFFGWIIDLFGPFPYGDELRFAGGPTVWLGFEHPANIVLYEELAALGTDYADTMTHVTMHEITHQWAGDRVTIASEPDFVWKEAIAEYIPYVYEDEKLGADIGAASREYWDSVALLAQNYPRPTDSPMPHVSEFYGDVYGPGPMVLFVQLEALIGRDAVLAGLQAFLKDPGARSVAELQAALEAASGEDLGPYFDVWVFGAGVPEWPTMKITTVQNGSEVTVTVTQENPSGKLYGCVVEVDVQGATTSATAMLDFGVAPSSAVASATVTLAEPVVGAVLDPRNKVVARESIAAAGAPKPPKQRPIWIF